MKINIAGEELLLTVPFSSQDIVRQTEQAIGDLYKGWRIEFPKKSTTELLAMIAYQYASYYLDLRQRYDNAIAAAQDTELLLDTLLNKDTN